jgi:hypothetical protein
MLILIAFAACEPGRSPAGTEYAGLQYRESWLHHPVFGDPSWDTFIHHPANPVIRGTAGAEWPVNGSLFSDPVSGCRYLYAGIYSRNYAFNGGGNRGGVMYCAGYRSCNGGATWDSLGRVLPLEGVRMNGEKTNLGGAPDVSVVYDGGKYHMIFDWLSQDFAWNRIGPSGIGHAVADKPEGPFIIDPEPVFSNYGVLANPLAGKYNRAYAASLIKRKNDWMVLFMLDSGEHFSWALVAITAASFSGPWSEPVIINSVESPRYYPALLEYFPAFSYDGYVYAPATSVSVNRNFQAIFRSPVEKAHDPSAWELWKEGSLWHAIPAENEHEGIWGQTLSGFVDAKDTFRVMFPSLDPNDFGTINTASRSWTNAYYDRGFRLSGHKAPSVSFLYQEYLNPELDIDLRYSGPFSVIFDARAPLGPDAPASNNRIHPLMLSDQKRIAISGNRWELIQSDEKNQKTSIASGEFIPGDTCKIRFGFSGSKRSLTLNGTEVWTGATGERGGHIGLCCEEHAYVDVFSFRVQGKAIDSSFGYLYTELLQGAGNRMSSWNVVKNDSLYTYGIGAETALPGTRVKLNFTGTRFTVYSPKKPAFGKIRLTIDGGDAVILDTRSDRPCKSAPVYQSGPLPAGRHAVVMECVNGVMGVDCVRVW